MSSSNLKSHSAQVLHQDLKVGILGGGQLARMLALAAHSLGMKPYILSEKQDDPAAQVTAYWFDSQTTSLQEFCSKVDFVTFESEFVDSQKLKNLEPALRAKFFPQIELMEKLQIRSTQKELLLQFKVPTAAYRLVSRQEDLDKVWSELGPFVLKKCFGGYDGYGTFYARNKEELAQLKKNFQVTTHHYIAEKMIHFQRELAVILVRNQHGQSLSLPFAQSHQENSRCDWVLGPIKPKQAQNLLKKLKVFLNKIDYVGCIAFEIFDTGKELLINEIAPRVHNSGHYSMDALSESQFSLHLRAVTGLKIDTPQTLVKNFVMTNLLGQSQKHLEIPSEVSGQVHLYGKKENRPGRKMGHINYHGEKAKTLLQKALKERRKIQL